MSRTALITSGSLVVACTAVAAAIASETAHTSASSAACPGEYRWSIKTLADPEATSVHLTPVNSSVAALWPKAKPSGFDPTHRNAPFETTTYRVTADLAKVRWVNDPPTATRKGGDLDIHLVLADPNDSSKTMVVEFPFPKCDHAIKKLKARMTKARHDFLDDCFRPSGTFRML